MQPPSRSRVLRRARRLRERLDQLLAAVEDPNDRTEAVAELARIIEDVDRRGIANVAKWIGKGRTRKKRLDSIKRLREGYPRMLPIVQRAKKHFSGYGEHGRLTQEDVRDYVAATSDAARLEHDLRFKWSLVSANDLVKVKPSVWLMKQLRRIFGWGSRTQRKLLASQPRAHH